MSTMTNGEKLVCMTGLEAIRHTLYKLEKEFNFKNDDFLYYDEILSQAKEIVKESI